jgi:alkylated DNA nucleotide flippase Atl1
MASSRADEVAEILWELKRADKISTYTLIARRAGFSAGSSGRAILTCLKTVRRDWPHLHWWRAVQDDGCLEAGSEQESFLREAGFPLESAAKAGALTVKELEVHVLKWETAEKPVEAAVTSENSAAV